MAVKVAIVAILGFLFVYGGLIYLGATGSGFFQGTEGHTKITVELIGRIGGDLGRYALSISVLFACLTTAIGLTTAVSEYFEKLLNRARFLSLAKC